MRKTFAIKPAELFSSRALQTLVLGVCLITANQAQADSVTLSESQKDVVKCGPVIKDPDTGEKFQECFQNTTGSYSVTAKLSASTFEENGIFLQDLTEETPLGITIGTFDFSGSLSTADEGKHQLTATKLQGTWTEHHEGCAKYNADSECTKPKQVTDGTVKISATLKGATITLTGKSDNEGNGRQIYGNLCASNGSGYSKTTDEDASISIGETSISGPITITCNVKTITKDPDGLKGGPFELTNMTIKAKLAPASSFQ